MGFRGKSYQSYNKNKPKEPVRLAFGIIGEEKAKPAITRHVAPEPYVPQDVQGTLDLKKANFSKVKPLPRGYVKRVMKNIEKIYEEGLAIKSNSKVDAENDVLKVSFSFNQTTIDRIKGLDRNERSWDADNKLWNVFVGCFDDVFDILGRGFILTEPAYKAILKFLQTPYYAAIARSKYGKLLVRESWFDELEIEETGLPETNVEDDSNEQPSQASADQKAQAALAENEILNMMNSFSFQRHPYEHQRIGIKFLLSRPYAALLDEMGCGKSFQIASTIAILLKNNLLDLCLIVAPKSLIKTWQDELKLAGINEYCVISGTKAQREKVLKQSSQVYLVHYEGMRIEQDKLAEILQQGRSLLVCDESQRIKNFTALTTKSAIHLSQFCERSIISTGTPIANRPLDLFSQFLVMDKGATFGTQFSKFKNTFCIFEYLDVKQGYKKVKIEKFMGIKNSGELRKRVASASLRRMKEEVLDLPPVIYKDYSIELSAPQKQLYAQMRDKLYLEYQGLSTEQMRKEASNFAVKLLRLAQLASNPALVVPNYDGPIGKMTELESLLDDILSNDEKKVIIWSHFVTNIGMIAEKFAEFGPVCHTGEMSTESRQESIELFQNDPTKRVFIATPQSAKEGLTLLPKDGKMKADTMIYFDLNFDSASYIQSQARFHRIGQTADKCLIIHLLGEDTVDEKIKIVLMDKLAMAKSVINTSSALEEIEKNELLDFSDPEKVLKFIS